MKTILLSITCLITALTLSAQEKEWKEMNDFHTVMSKTFHPAEKGNLQPTRDSIDILITKAKAWQSSPAPAGYDAPSIKPVLDKLVMQCVAIKAAIAQKKSNIELQKMINRAHSAYHEIVQKTN